MSAARIGRIRMKSGGATIRVISGSPDDDFVLHMRSRAANMARDDADLTAYVIITTYANGEFDFAHGRKANHPIPMTLWPSYIEEIARRRMIIVDEVEATVEWMEGVFE